MALQILFAALLAVQYTAGQRAASCSQPFVDASGGKAYWWMCAKDCPGGMAWADIACCCACQRPEALQSYRARCSLLESTTTTEAIEVPSSSTTPAAEGSYLRPEEAAVAMPLGHSWSRTTVPPPFLVRSDAATAAALAALLDNSTEEEALAAAFNASRAAGATLLEVASIIASTASSLPDLEDSSPRSIEELTRLVADGIVTAIGHDKDAGRIAALAATQIAFDSHMSVEFTMQLAEATALATGASPDDVARIMASLPEDAAIMAQKRAAAGTTPAPAETESQQAEQPPSTPAPLSLTVDPARLGNKKLITLEGDYASVVTNTKKFLIECTVALSPVLCLKVEPGSIVLTISGATPDVVDAALAHVAAGGLDLPSFGVLQPPSSSSNSSQDSLPAAGSQASSSPELSSWVVARGPGPSRGIDASFLAGSESVATDESENGFDVWFSLLTVAIAVIGATIAGVWLYRRHRDRIRPASEDFEEKQDAWESTPTVPSGVPTSQNATPGFPATAPPKSYRNQPSNFPAAHNPWIAGTSGFVSAPSFDVRPPGFGFPGASPPPPNYPHPFQPSPFLQPQHQPFSVSPGMHGGW